MRKVLVLFLGVWFRRRVLLRPASAPVLIFIVGAKCQLVLLVVLLIIVLCELHQGPRRGDRIMSASLGINVPVQAAEVVFGRSCEAPEPCTLQFSSLGAETRCEVKWRGA